MTVEASTETAAEMHSDAAGKPQLPCDTCGSLFTRKRAWGRFCSSGCRNAFHSAGGRLDAITARALPMYRALCEIAKETGTPYGRIAAEAIKGLKPPESPKALLEKVRA